MGCSSSKEIDAQIKDNFFGDDHHRIKTTTTSTATNSTNKNKNEDVQQKNEILDAIITHRRNNSSSSSCEQKVIVPAVLPFSFSSSDSTVQTTIPQQQEVHRQLSTTIASTTTPTVVAKNAPSISIAASASSIPSGRSSSSSSTKFTRRNSSTKSTKKQQNDNNNSNSNDHVASWNNNYEAPPSSDSFFMPKNIDKVYPSSTCTQLSTGGLISSSSKRTKQEDQVDGHSGGGSTTPSAPLPPPPPPPPLSIFLEENNSNHNMNVAVAPAAPITPRVLDDDDFSVAPSLAVEKREIIAGGEKKGEKEIRTTTAVASVGGNQSQQDDDNQKTKTAVLATDVLFDDIYLRGKHLGVGAFATVFVAQHRPTGAYYAVKEVDRTKMIWNQKNHLQLEIENMFKVREGPNIVQLYEVYYNNSEDDHDANDGNGGDNQKNKKHLCHMILELMPGGELFDRVIEKRKFTEREARDSIRCVLEALNYMHDQRVAHRDLKPENLLLESNDRSKLTPVKLADFGFAKSIESKNSCRSLCGTPGYLAPEILERFPSYDVPCDMWSVGVILFLLLGGYLPFDDVDEKKVFDRTRNAKYYFFPQHWKHVSNGAKTLITNCLILNPSRRFTAKDCLNCDWMVNTDAARDDDLTGVVDKLKVARNKGKHKMRAAVQTLVAANRLQQLNDDFSNYLEDKRQDSIASHMSCMTTGTRYGHAKFVEDSPSGKPFELYYNISETLGKDEISTIHRCRNKKTRFHYGVKHVHVSNLDGTVLRTVQDEITSLKLLRGGPYIIRLLDVFDEKNNPENIYLVFEEMKGGNLLERIVTKEVYTEREARQVCKAVFTAIDYCHKKKVAHRDIKPHNIYLTEEGDDTTVRVGNFGFAKKVTHKHSLQTLCGSAQYVAPEIIDYEMKFYDQTCDIWSLGVFTYVLLAGYVPFEGVLDDLTVEILTGKYEFHAEYWADISNSAKDMISSMLVVDPRGRISVAKALASKWMEMEEERLVLRDLSFAQKSIRKSLQPTSKVKAAVDSILDRNKFSSIASMFGNETDIASVVSPSRQHHGSLLTMDMIDEDESFGDSFLWGKQIGNGTFSVVHEVRMKRTKEMFAAKRISRKDLHPSDAIALQDEIEALQQVTKCEEIVTLFNVFDEPDYTFLVFEIMEGGDLIDRIVKKQHYTEFDAKEVSQKLLMGVNYCHKKKIANRDLKPENVLLKAGSDTNVKISDFGYAKKVTFPNSLRTQCGTEGYVAPEILEHRPAYDVSCDMWSLGVIIYIVLGGYRPFRGEGEDVMRQIRYGDYKFHKRYWSHVSDDAKNLIKGMLTVDPEKRITAEKALEDRWIQSSDDVSLKGVELSNNMKDLKNLRNAKRKIKAATKAIIATNKLQSIGGYSF